MSVPRHAVIAGFDGTSRVPGTALGAASLWRALRTADSDWSVSLMRAEGRSPAMFCRRIHRVATSRPIGLLLGGEHTVTFPHVEALVRRDPAVCVVVLDAHHDAYDYPLLTHYSLFHHLRDELGVRVLVVGARHELELVSAGCELLSAEAVRRTGPESIVAAIADFVAGTSFHFSIDFDVIDPDEFAAVGDPVAGGLAIADVATIAGGVLARGPVSLDLVEYNAMRDPHGHALVAAEPLLREVRRWMA